MPHVLIRRDMETMRSDVDSADNVEIEKVKTYRFLSQMVWFYCSAVFVNIYLPMWNLQC